MQTPLSIVDEIDSFIEEFVQQIEPIQRQLYNKVAALIKDLSLNPDGTIKQTASNSQIIKKVERELQNIVYSPKYQKNVAGIRIHLNNILSKQKSYFKAVDSEFLHPAVSDELLKQSFNTAVTALTESGVKANVASKAGDIVSKGIREGSSYGDMQTQLREFMIGTPEVDGKLVSYSKQVVNDTLHGSARTYNAIISKKLKSQWFMYVGALTKGEKNKTNNKRHGGSRPICIYLVKKKWIHISEIPGICRGEIDGKKISTQGMMPDTNASNFVNRCGGFFCGHGCIPVPEENVPSKLRRKFGDETVVPDDEEKASDRPKRKKK